MSHFSQIRTRIKNRNVLLKALSVMGLDINNKSQSCRGFFGDTAEVDISAHAGKNYDVGFVKDDHGAYQCVGDWEILPRILKMTQEEFGSSLKRTYAKCLVQDYLDTNDMTYDFVENDNDGYEFIVRENL